MVFSPAAPRIADVREACGAVPFPGCHVSLHTPPSLWSFLPLIKPPHVRAQGSREICSLRLRRGIWAGRAKYQKQEPAHVMGPTPCPSCKPHEEQLPHTQGWDLCPGSEQGTGIRGEGNGQGGTQELSCPLSLCTLLPACSGGHRRSSQSISQGKGPGTFEQAGKSLEAAAGMCPREPPTQPQSEATTGCVLPDWFWVLPSKPAPDFPG